MYNYQEYKNLLIPKVILSLYPKMKYDDFASLKKDSIFNSKIARVCEKCFLEITKYCNISGVNTENLLRSLKQNTVFPLISYDKKIQMNFSTTKYSGFNNSLKEFNNQFKSPNKFIKPDIELKMREKIISHQKNSSGPIGNIKSSYNSVKKLKKVES